MVKKNPERALRRKRQSERDKLNYLNKYSINIQADLVAKWLLIDDPQFVWIPITYDYVNIATAYITSLLSGQLCSLGPKGYVGFDLERYRENANFIRKSLSSAQMSFPSLICCLYYIDYAYTHHKEALLSRPWSFRELFATALLLGDKFVEDVSYTTKDWAYYTQIDPKRVKKLELEFLKMIQYKVLIKKHEYYNFLSYLTLFDIQRHFNHTNLPLSYTDLNILSKWISPNYLKRLNITLRPFDAMLLLAKTAASMCILYAATMATIVYGSYIISLNIEYISTLIEKNRLAMVLISSMDILTYYRGNRYKALVKY